MPNDPHDDFLAPSGMAAARAVMVARFPWFEHKAPVSAFDGIKRIGLEPRQVRGFFRPVPAVVARRITVNSDRAVCLWPKGKSTLVVGADKNERLFRLAVRPHDLPVRLGVDWSFDAPWAAAERLRINYPGRDIGEIFAYVANEYGAFMSYDPIPPEALLVQIKGQSDDATAWHPLLQADINAIARY